MISEICGNHSASPNQREGYEYKMMKAIQRAAFDEELKASTDSGKCFSFFVNHSLMFPEVALEGTDCTVGDQSERHALMCFFMYKWVGE